jgi:hypothetical protein
VTPELREETMQALLDECDRVGHRGIWIMSQAWLDDLHVMFDVPAHPTIPVTLLGLPVEVRNDAGFPKLEGTVSPSAGRVP